MIAKNKNQSERRLFLQGGRLDILLWEYSELNRQLNETNDECQPIQFERGLELLKECLCPCGCGLKNDICPDRAAFTKRLNDEIPF